MNSEVQTETKKVSEIFLRFVAPLLHEVPKDVSLEYLKRLFIFPILVWNAVSLQAWGSSDDYIKKIIDQLLKSEDPESAKAAEPLVQFWVNRKIDMFPNENWGIEDVVTYRDFNGELISRVIARAPDRFKHQLPSHNHSPNHQSTLN